MTINRVIIHKNDRGFRMPQISNRTLKSNSFQTEYTYTQFIKSMTGCLWHIWEYQNTYRKYLKHCRNICFIQERHHMYFDNLMKTEDLQKRRMGWKKTNTNSTVFNGQTKWCQSYMSSSYTSTKPQFLSSGSDWESFVFYW